MPANNSSTHHYLLIFKSQFYVNNKQNHLEADPSAHRLHRHSHRHHPRCHQLHGHVITIAAGINHDARPFRCYMPFYSQCAKNLRSLMNTAENILCVKNLRSLMSLRIINNHQSLTIQPPFPPRPSVNKCNYSPAVGFEFKRLIVVVNSLTISENLGLS